MDKKEYSQEEMCGGMCGGDAGCESQACGAGCRQMYGMRCGRRHYLLRWALGILILVIVFIAGIKLGEFKQDMRVNGYGYRMMDRAYNGVPGYYGMMQGRDDTEAYYRSDMMRGTGVVAPVAPTQ